MKQLPEFFKKDKSRKFDKILFQDYKWNNIYSLPYHSTSFDIFTPILFNKQISQNLHSWMSLLLSTSYGEFDKILDIKLSPLNDGIRPIIQV